MGRIVAAIAAVILVLLAGLQLAKWSRANALPRVRAQSRASSGQTSADLSAPRVAPLPSDPAYVTVQAATVTPRLEAYGQVEPITPLPVNAAQEGVVTGLNVLPGMQVHAGQELAHLSGPEIQTALLQSEADARNAQAQLVTSQKTLAIQGQQLPLHLSTRATVQQAESAVAQAQTNFDNAQSHLQSVRQMMTLSAPSDGTVLALNASNGELINAGQPVLTLQTTGRLWLAASYYAADLTTVRVGMKGVFAPADGSSPIPVRVRSVSGSMTAGQGESIGLVATASTARWINGEFGAVTLNLPPRSLVAVPTQSLILDQGKWWVLVHTAQGDKPQEVVPGPSQDWQTFLETGVNPGSEIVVENAYLLFHRGIAARYQPPD